MEAHDNVEAREQKYGKAMAKDRKQWGWSLAAKSLRLKLTSVQALIFF
jgi:hypothetical protein